jgi:hypothetical protein
MDLAGATAPLPEISGYLSQALACWDPAHGNPVWWYPTLDTNFNLSEADIANSIVLANNVRQAGPQSYAHRQEGTNIHTNLFPNIQSRIGAAESAYGLLHKSLPGPVELLEILLIPTSEVTGCDDLAERFYWDARFRYSKLHEHPDEFYEELGSGKQRFYRHPNFPLPANLPAQGLKADAVPNPPASRRRRRGDRFPACTGRAVGWRDHERPKRLTIRPPQNRRGNPLGISKSRYGRSGIDPQITTSSPARQSLV